MSITRLGLIGLEVRELEATSLDSNGYPEKAENLDSTETKKYAISKCLDTLINCQKDNGNALFLFSTSNT